MAKNKFLVKTFALEKNDYSRNRKYFFDNETDAIFYFWSYCELIEHNYRRVILIQNNKIIKENKFSFRFK